MKNLLFLATILLGFCFIGSASALNLSQQSISPGSLNLIVVNGASIKVDYTSGVAKVYLNGNNIWEGHGSKIRVSNGAKVTIKINGKQIWPKE